jgi:thiopurine S-methyltransferase
MDGPPFSVAEADIHKLYASRYRIERLWSEEVLEDIPRFKDKGLSGLVESVYRLQPVVDDVADYHE